MRPIFSSLLTISALLASVPASAAVLQSVSLSPASVTGGTAVSGTVTLDRPALGGGVVVTLSSNASAASVVPTQVTVPAGATTASFTVNTTPVAVRPNAPIPGVVATITASPAAGFGSPKIAELTVLTPLLSGFGVPGPVVGGQNAAGWVQLTGPAPAGGIVITLLSANERDVKPASVTIPAGARDLGFHLATASVAAPTSVIISASRSTLNFKDVTLTLIPPSLAVLGCEPLQVSGGTSVTCKAWLDAPAATRVTVALASSNTAVATVPVPSSVNLDASQIVAPFIVTTQQAGTAGSKGTQVTISGSYAGQTKGSTITVVQLPLLTDLQLTPTTVRSGNASMITVGLTAPAPAGGAAVKLSSANPAVAGWGPLGLPFDVKVPAGQNQLEVPIGSRLATGSAAVDLSASYAGVTRTAVLTVVAVPALASVAFSPDVISHVDQNNGRRVGAIVTLTSPPLQSYQDPRYINCYCESSGGVSCNVQGQVPVTNQSI